MRELDRRSKDADDRTRFLLASVFTPRFALCYEISEDVFVMNDPAAATLFKRERAARAIKTQLGGRITLMRCRVDSRGNLVLPSISRREINRAVLVKRRGK